MEIESNTSKVSWAPVTPVKPNQAESRPIYSNKQENQTVQPNGLESEQIWQRNPVESNGFPASSQESRSPGINAGSSMNSEGINKEFSNCVEIPVVEESQEVENVYSYSNFSFSDLLALADAASASSASTPNVNGTKSHFSCIPVTPVRADFSTYSRPAFDLNSPAQPISDAVLGGGTSSLFAPNTPDQCKGAKQIEISNTSNSERDGKQNQTEEEKEVNKIVDVVKLHSEKEQSSDALSIQLQVKHIPERGGNESSDINKTAHQKPRRKRYTPKVVREGQPKKTPKPRTPNPKTSYPVDPNKPPTGKRKYVRKKGINEPTDTPPVVAASITSELKTGANSRRSCRRSLNFDSENQVRDENSSCSLPAENDLGSSIQIHSTVQLRHEMEETLEKEQAEAENYITVTDKQPDGHPAQIKTNEARDKSVDDVQSASKRGKCRIVFSDVTHDKGSSFEQMLNSNSHSAPRSPNDSNCSTSACSARGKQARGLKRQYSSTTGDVLRSINAIGAHHNSLQAYLAMFPAYECDRDMIPAMYFPPIYKKKRTEKWQNSAVSISVPTAAGAQNPKKQATEYPLSGAQCYHFTPEIAYASGVQCNVTDSAARISETNGAQYNLLGFRSMLPSGNSETRKKRSKGPTRVRDIASLIEIVEGMQMPTCPTRGVTTSSDMQGFGTFDHPNTCREALVADNLTATTTKKRTKRTPGPYAVITQKDMFSVEALIEHVRHLDINAERQLVSNQGMNAPSFYSTRYQEQNALVLYKREGTVVPFEGQFNPIKKRQPRPKVDLDDETTRVWKLLLQDINSEGINGTDEEKEKWWEEERRVFCGRADSFIARMHLIQGDRRFSRWKGSVVDSVVGVFLTQNVSDHLSSSAFMSLVARFPLLSKGNHVPLCEERMDVSLEPEACVLNPDDTIEWCEVKSNQPACDRSFVALSDAECYEEKEVVNSNESSASSTDGARPKDDSNCQFVYLENCGMGLYQGLTENRSTTPVARTMSISTGDQKELDDVISSQSSVTSFQKPVGSSISQNNERSFSHTNLTAEAVVVSRPNSFTGATSFLELLRMAETTKYGGVHNPQVCYTEMIKSNEPCNLQKKDKDRPDGSKASPGCLNLSANHVLHLSPHSEEVECIDKFGELTKFSDVYKEDKELTSSEENRSSIESAPESTCQHITAMDSHEASKSSDGLPLSRLEVEAIKISQSQTTYRDTINKVESTTQEKIVEVEKVQAGNFMRKTLDVTQGNSSIDAYRKNVQKEIESNTTDHAYVPQKTLNGVSSANSKAKRKRTGKEKKDEVDWDSLRKQAQANGVRERTANTMDSVDWEAVHLADVEDIAYTIRERGMNNMLAERIKKFLDRLVTEHGSIDLEWLRDVPPDKAKEYLLSIRGLGLKSVECVRLLTLHHLAFPVDTNVGRIAVRLGWVPLQPLPESLQLHLLEMYPVLESIQKYLWPRLCKLDQRTLYELHYQMITFGKVFCTKSKPNCNACPMRGECRHFASAFASARLALPTVEDKSIVTSKNDAVSQSSAGIINRLQLTMPQTSNVKAPSEVSNCEPIIEVPASPEPIIEVPASPEPEKTLALEDDIEDSFGEDPDEIPTIKLNIEEFTQTLQEYVQKNMELQECDVSKALVSLTPEAASIPTVKLKNVSRLRTEHQVYELPDTHPLLEGLDTREPDDPCKYLLAIWTPGETQDSIHPPGGQCSSQESGSLCDDNTCFACNSAREADSQTVRATILIPCRTAMRGSFPLNGTYFQVNEVFADHESSLNPINVPRSWIWNLPRKTVFFGTSIPTIFKGLSTEGIQFCFWKGFVCVRGFDRTTRSPRPLIARLHFPASKLVKAKEKNNGK